MTCEEICEALLDYVEGVLPEGQGQDVRAHLADCDACRQRMRSMRGLVGDLSAARSIEQQAFATQSQATLPLSPQPSGPLSQLADFEILGELGRGGMGVVYRARQRSLNRIVALKVLSAAGLQDERAIARFQREAQAAARLHHTNIVPIYAQGSAQGFFYYAMELIDGRSLDKVLKDADAFARKTVAGTRSQAATGVDAGLLSAAGHTRRDFKRIARMMAEVAEALQHAHEQGIVHRDIKPQNLLLGSDDRLHVTDFGLARILDEPGLTLSTEMVGTPAYMPPEQIQSGRRIDARADLYSLGVTLYELLTHERPFVADTYERLIDQVMRKEPRPPRKIDASIPIDLETICLRAMEKEPGRRFATAAEMARDLRRYAEDFPIASRRVGAVGRTIRWVRRNRALAGALGATLVVAVLAPLTWFLIQALANRRIEAAENLMFDDYRQPQRALDALGWAQHFGGRRDQAELLLAWIYNPDDPPRRTCDILEQRLARRPDDRDARYLLTWAYVRRTQDDGPVFWAKARESLLSADQSPNEVSALGEFFHGQALVGRDPVAALTRFEAAISKRSGFTQAALHKARAYNYTIYFLRTLDYYADCQRSLEFICNDLQPNEAYPRYLLSIAHYLAAEIYDRKGQAKERDEAYERALHWAQLAQQAKPSDSRGYIAEAQCRESQAWSGQTQERLASAAAAYDRLDEPAIAAGARTSDRQERERYEARVCFWLGDMEKTARVVNERYGGNPKAPITTQFDCEGRLIHAILERTRDRPLAARDWLASARTTYGEQLLLIEAAWRLTDGAPPEAFWPPGVINYQRLSDGWTEEWLSTLIDYVHGTAEWESLLAAAHREVIWPGDERRRLAGAYFHRGVLELAAGDRAAAQRSFAEAWEMRDFELYCFLAKFLLLKMRMDPAWPDWLPAR